MKRLPIQFACLTAVFALAACGDDDTVEGNLEDAAQDVEEAGEEAVDELEKVKVDAVDG